MTTAQNLNADSDREDPNKSRLGITPTKANAADWWAVWAKENQQQIEAYNAMVEEDGLWSDDCRLF